MDTTIIAISVFLLTLFLTAIFGTLLVQKWGRPLFQEVMERGWRVQEEGLVARVETLESDVERLPRTWEEFAVDAKKIHDRTRWHIRRVKTELEQRGLSDAEIDTLDGTLRPLDGEGGEDRQLSILQDVVEEVPTTPEESWMARALRRKYGNG
jgi:hypothetical protein